MDIFEIATLWILIGFVCGCLAANLAEKKGFSGLAWFASGFLFGILGLIAAAGLPKKEDIYQHDRSLTKVCPMCAETIKREAQVCKYCGKTFDKEEIVSGLERVLLDRPLVTRHEVAVALINIGTTPALNTVLKDGDYKDKRSAILALAEIKDGSAILALIEGLKDRSIRKKVSSALISIGKPALPFLEEVIKREGKPIQKYAEKVISEITRKT